MSKQTRIILDMLLTYGVILFVAFFLMSHVALAWLNGRL